MKKELYIAPELELLSLTPAERLASETDVELSDNAVSVDPNVDIDILL